MGVRGLTMERKKKEERGAHEREYGEGQVKLRDI